MVPSVPIACDANDLRFEYLSLLGLACDTPLESACQNEQNETKKRCEWPPLSVFEFKNLGLIQSIQTIKWPFSKMGVQFLPNFYDGGRFCPFFMRGEPVIPSN